MENFVAQMFNNLLAISYYSILLNKIFLEPHSTVLIFDRTQIC